MPNDKLFYMVQGQYAKAFGEMLQSLIFIK
jgi:hypothetical protein